MKVNILGVSIDNLSKQEALNIVSKWVKGSQKRYIVTPNIEFVMLAQHDEKFKKILNQADLAIPDSSRFGWAYTCLQTKSPILKLIYLPNFVFPRFFAKFKRINTLTGTDLMEDLIALSSEKGFTIGLLGGKLGVAEKLRECLLARNPKLKVTFCSSGAEINNEGWQVLKEKSAQDSLIPKTDILFVAFGHGKQEKWIVNNLAKQQVRVMMGVGGAFDYLSGQVARAPEWLRSLGFEWLFRLALQPWRIKRFGALIKFIWLILVS